MKCRPDINERVEGDRGTSDLTSSSTFHHIVRTCRTISVGQWHLKRTKPVTAASLFLFELRQPLFEPSPCKI